MHWIVGYSPCSVNHPEIPYTENLNIVHSIPIIHCINSKEQDISMLHILSNVVLLHILHSTAL